ncbi:MAG: orotidine-5'-phosphate decarboxylase [Armatimonadota bacterium]
MQAAERIIVALDTPEVEQAVRWVQQLRGRVGAFKLGLEFLHAAGPQGVEAVQEAGADRVFLDTKFSDIPNTVAGAVRSTCRQNPWLLNVHAMAGAAAMRAARDAAVEHASSTGVPRPLVIAVTVLTSLDREALGAIGVDGEVRDAVVRLALLARESGLDGVVASPLEIEAIREACGREFLIVTPGIRPAGAAKHDQLRTATPASAVAAGADYLVIGRALTHAGDPAAAAAEIVAEIEAGA